MTDNTDGTAYSAQYGYLADSPLVGQKVKMAERLRCETTMTLAWIAERLRMGTQTHLAHLPYWKQRDKMK